MLFKKSLIALCLLSALLVSCGEEAVKPSDDTTPVQESTPETVVSETEDALLPDGVPEDMDLGGRVLNVYYQPLFAEYMINQEEQTGDNVEDAIFRANSRTAEDLNCSFTYYQGTVSEMNVVRNSFFAGDGSFDILNSPQYLTANLISEEMLYNFGDSSMIDVSQPWWYQSYIEEATIGKEKIYLLAGDYDLTPLRCASIGILSTGLMNDLDISLDAIYDKIYDGTWTMDYVYELTSSVYRDLNGDSKRDVGDLYGTASYTMSDVDHWLVDSGIRATTRDENGIPRLSFVSERAEKTVNLIHKIFRENEGMYYKEGAPWLEMFSEKRVLFLCMKFFNLDQMRNSDTGYTVVPMPKLDEQTEYYSSLVHNGTSIVAMLDNVKDADAVCAVITKRAKYGYYEVMPQYYDVSLKIKYSTDDDDERSRMMDLIRDSITTDFAYVYPIGVTSVWWSPCSSSKSLDFSSLCARNEDKWNAAMEEWLEIMQEN